MTTKTAGYLILYGAFLIVMGLLGYLSNPEKAKTALMSGGTFGALSLVWGRAGRARRPVDFAGGGGNHGPAGSRFSLASERRLVGGH